MQCFRFMAMASLWTAAIAPIAPADPIDFGRDVRPVLAGKCFQCHGPDEAARQAGLRLDTFEGATMALKSGAPAIVPGDASQGSFFARITTHDEVDRMPPPEVSPALDDATVDLLRRWVNEGAAYAPHWSFVKPEKAPLPPVDDLAWPRNAIDHFIAAGLRDAGLAPAQEADRHTLIRRLSLDLTGLPPAPEAVEAFVNDPSPVAYEKLVEDLLASPRFGERWARIWLDIARYADTKGYEADRHRDMWRFRDWVIEAFNQDMPFDQFTIEQMAGDLLPEPTLEQQLATAFHRNTMTNDEGGTDNEEFRTAAVLDRVDTTMAAWMGLTMNCAQCHTHKYDPITQKEYYQFYAFLNQTQDADLFPEESPVLPAPTRDQQREMDFLRERLDQAADAMRAALPARNEPQEAWEQRIAAEGGGAPVPGAWQSLGPIPQDDFEQAFASDGGLDVTSRDLAAPEGYEWIPRPDWTDGEVRNLEGQTAITYLRRTIQAAEPAAYPVKLGSNDAIQVWLNGVEVHSNKVLRSIEPGSDEVTLNLVAGDNLLLLKITNAGGAYAYSYESGYTGLPLELLKIARTPAASRAADQADQILAYYREHIAPELAPLRDDRAQLQARLDEINAAVPKIPVLRELPPGEQRATHIFEKGSFLSPGDEVFPGTPAFLHPLPYDAPRNRLGMARWLVDRENPLTARVLVNRFWTQFFGVGIVETAEDFGQQGELPINQPLLDWLAVDLMENGWSMKQLCRTIVTSATYRQASAVRPETQAKDPYNRLLARGPRFRLEAEMVRDQALAASGLLSDDLFGPSVMPPQPEGIWQVVYSGDEWKTSEGGDRYRRGLYTYWRRTSPYPSMITFDAPSREVCTLRRIPTNTPLQALTTLNDPVYVEAAQALARRVISEAPDPSLEGRIRHAFLLAASRPPEDAEIATVRRLYEDARATYAGNADGALAMATVPLGPALPGQDDAELAAWTVVGNVLLNLDEVLTKR
ncbi:MAG: PSD1 domain-containing protein [Candidatus Hydrogenedentes bacterium]|nr:PSD1 domain-containing protein [Candidatus Hydrogenedentota bacterium]